MAKKTGQLHARDHLPGGIDPLPLLLSPFSGSFVDYMATFEELEAWYRLGSGDGGFGQALDSENGWDLGNIGDVAQVELTGGNANMGVDDDGAKLFLGGSTATSEGFGYYGDSYHIDDSPGWTMVGWAMPEPPRLDAVGLSTLVFGPWNPGGSAGGLGFFFNNVTMQLSLLWANGATDVTLGPVGLDYVWYHLAVTWDGITVIMYVNGAQVDAVSPGFEAARQQLFIANNYTGVEQVYFSGAVDEVAIFSRVLTESEIAGFVSVGSDDAPGNVLTVGDDGDPVWAPPPATGIRVYEQPTEPPGVPVGTIWIETG